MRNRCPFLVKQGKMNIDSVEIVYLCGIKRVENGQVLTKPEKCDIYPRCRVDFTLCIKYQEHIKLQEGRNFVKIRKTITQEEY